MLNIILRGSVQSLASALFGILLLLAFVITQQMSWPIAGIYRYDILFAYALTIQVFLVYFKLETQREVWVITIFHMMAMVMELFLTHPKIGSWYYPEQAIFRIANVPLFAGFMYSAVGSLIARGLRLFNASFTNFPNLIAVGLLAVASYANFFTKFFVPDVRNLLFIISVILFWRTKVLIQIYNNKYSYDIKKYQLPFLPLLLSLAFLVWLAENIATFTNIWRYPSQENLWHMVGWGKVGSWYLLLILSLVLVVVLLGKSNTKGHWQLL